MATVRRRQFPDVSSVLEALGEDEGEENAIFDSSESELDDNEFEMAFPERLLEKSCSSSNHMETRGHETATFEESDAEMPIVREDVEQVGHESVGQDVSTAPGSNTVAQGESDRIPELSRNKAKRRQQAKRDDMMTPNHMNGVVKQPKGI